MERFRSWTTRYARRWPGYRATTLGTPSSSISRRVTVAPWSRKCDATAAGVRVSIAIRNVETPRSARSWLTFARSGTVVPPAPLTVRRSVPRRGAPTTSTPSSPPRDAVTGGAAWRTAFPGGPLTTAPATDATRWSPLVQTRAPTSSVRTVRVPLITRNWRSTVRTRPPVNASVSRNRPVRSTDARAPVIPSATLAASALAAFSSTTAPMPAVSAPSETTVSPSSTATPTTSAAPRSSAPEPVASGRIQTTPAAAKAT
jgi:hypothetical protein